jgi:RNA polymerase sigma-70 factor, ECF subfamily
MLDKLPRAAHYYGRMSAHEDFERRVRECADRLAAIGVDALGVLFDLTAQRLVRFATALTRHQQDAEDAVQAALARLAAQPQRLTGLARPWAYLLRMVRNEVLANARRQQHQRTGGSLADLVTLCPVDEAEREESHRAVWAALRLLPPEQAEVIVLKIWEGMTFAQIGEVLELSPHTAAKRYQYGMAKLTARLSRQREALHD